MAARNVQHFSGQQEKPRNDGRVSHHHWGESRGAVGRIWEDAGGIWFLARSKTSPCPDAQDPATQDAMLC